MLRIEAAGEVPAETAETLLHRVTLGALLIARSVAILTGADARRLLCHQWFECCPELPKYFTPIGTPLGNGVELLLHPSGEAEINKGGEVRRKKVAHRLAESRRAQSVLAITVYVLALLDALNDRRICGRSTDSVLLQLFHQRRLSEARLWLRLVGYRFSSCDLTL